MDRQADRVSQVTWVSPNSSPDRWIDRVNQVCRVGDMEQKMGGSSRVANTKSRITENSANTENRVMKNLANTENQLMQDSGGRKPEEEVLLQARGQLHGGAQGVLLRHKNTDCKRCVKESWSTKGRGRAGLLV
jgi:hypothetical protein